MPLSNCLDQVDEHIILKDERKSMLQKAEEYKKNGLSDSEAENKVLTDYHEKLHNDINKLRKTIGVKEVKYIPNPNKSEDIQKINSEYETKITDKKKELQDAIQKPSTTESVLRNEGVQRESELPRVEQDNKSEKPTEKSEQKKQPEEKKSVLERDIKEVSVDDIINEIKEAAKKRGLTTKDLSNDTLKSGSKDAVENYVERAKSVLKTLFPDATLETFGSTKEYIKAGGTEDTRGIGHLEKNGKHRILLNLEKIAEDNSGKTAYHEVIHPILYEAYTTKPEELNTLWNDVAASMKDVEGFQPVLEHAGLYGGNERGMEGLTEFLAQVADGNINLKDAPVPVIHKAIELLNRLLKALGIDFKFNNVKDFTEFAGKIKEAFSTGEAERLKGEIKGTNIDKVYAELEKTRELEPDKHEQLLELLKEKVSSEVEAGNLTQEQADKILEDNGIKNERESVGGIAQRIREKRAETTGVLPSEIGEGWNKENALARGRELIADGVDPYKLIKQFKKDKRLSADDMSVFQAHAIELQRATDKAADSGDNKAYENALFKENDFLDDVKKAQTEWSRTGMAQQGEYNFDAGSFNSIKRAKAVKTGKPQEDLPPEIKEQSEKVKALEEQNKELQKKYEDALNKAAEIEKNETSKKYSEKAKAIADKFRKLKTKPFIFKDENGNTIDIQKMGISWNDLVELGAKAIEKTGEIADGVTEILDKIKDAEWYAKLSNNDKEKLEKQLTAHYEDSIKETPEAKNIKRLEKQLEDLQNGIAKQSDAVKRQLSEKEKELQDQIFEAKKNLGLIASKELPIAKINKTDEQIKLDRLQKELEDLQHGIVKHKSSKVEDTQAIKDLKDKIFEAKKNLGLISSKESKPQEKISPEEKNIEQLQKELDRLQTESKLKSKTDKREITDEEKDIQNQIKLEQDKIKYNNLVKEFANKKDNKFTPEQSANMWDYAKKAYINDNPDYKVTDMVNGVAMDLGLTPEQVRHALAQKPETKRISDAIYRNQYEKNKAHKTIQNWVNKTPDHTVKKLLDTIASPFRGLATLGHGHALLFTHAGLNLFDPQVAKQFILASAKQFKLVYGDHANFEKAKTDLRKDPLFDKAVRAGLAVDPNTVYDDWQIANTFLNKLSIQGNKGFLVLKMMRMEIFKNEYNHLSAIEKADPETLKQVAKNTNHWTGTAGAPVSPFANAFIFAPNLIISKFARLTTDPIRAVAGFRKNATLDEKAASKIILKKSGRILASYAAALAANSALLALAGSTQKINYTDPTKSDWLKFKTGDATADKTVDVSSGMVSTTQFLAQIAMLPFESKEEIPEDYYGARSAGDALNNELSGFIRKMLSPFGSTVWDNIAHTDYAGNVLPWFNDKPKGTREKLSVPQYLAEKIPIPLAESVKVIHDQMREEGVDVPTAKHIAGGLIIGAIASAGVKIGNSPAERPSPFTEQDKKDPAFKYWIDKGMELPNTSLRSEVLTDQIDKTKKNISDYPKDIQDKYSQIHKDILKTYLNAIKNNGQVYINKYKNAKGEIVNEVSLSSGREAKKIKDLDKEELAQVLSLAQSKATTQAKQRLLAILHSKK